MIKSGSLYASRSVVISSIAFKSCFYLFIFFKQSLALSSFSHFVSVFCAFYFSPFFFLSFSLSFLFLSFSFFILLLFVLSFCLPQQSQTIKYEVSSHSAYSHSFSPNVNLSWPVFFFLSWSHLQLAFFIPPPSQNSEDK